MKINTSDIASTMSTVLSNPEYRSLFESGFTVTASKECGKEDCENDSHGAHCNDANDSDDMGMPSESEVSDMPVTAFDLAINNLISTSSLLESVGMEVGSTLSLKLASMVVEAKKLSKEQAKEKMKKLRDAKNKSSKDSKSKDSKSKDSKSKDSKSK